MDIRIKNTLNYIEDHLNDSLSLSKLSTIACLSPSQFHRIFKRETKKTPFKFIEEIKMNKAYRLLTDEDVFVTELALNLGYNDYETFSRAFKKYFHLAPDDLKAISNNLNASIGDNEKTVLLTFDKALPEADLLERLIQVAKAHNISKKDLKSAKMFKVEQKTNSETPKKVIKNKRTNTRDHGRKYQERI